MGSQRSAVATAFMVFLIRARAGAETPASPRVVVHINSPVVVELQRATGDKREPFYVVCTSPCDESLPVDGAYRVSGDAVRPSRRFALPAGSRRDVMVVEPRSATVFQVGIALIPIGGVTAGIGGWVALASALGGGGGDGDGPNIGLALLWSGLAVSVAGIVLTVVNYSSRVRLRTDPLELTGLPSADRAFWREPLRPDGAATPMWKVPLAVGRF